MYKPQYRIIHDSHFTEESVTLTVTATSAADQNGVGLLNTCLMHLEEDQHLWIENQDSKETRVSFIHTV